MFINYDHKTDFISVNSYRKPDAMFGGVDEMVDAIDKGRYSFSCDLAGSFEAIQAKDWGSNQYAADCIKTAIMDALHYEC